MERCDPALVAVVVPGNDHDAASGGRVSYRVGRGYRRHGIGAAVVVVCFARRRRRRRSQQLHLGRIELVPSRNVDPQLVEFVPRIIVVVAVSLHEIKHFLVEHAPPGEQPLGLVLVAALAPVGLLDTDRVAVHKAPSSSLVVVVVAVRWQKIRQRRESPVRVGRKSLRQHQGRQPSKEGVPFPEIVVVVDQQQKRAGGGAVQLHRTDPSPQDVLFQPASRFGAQNPSDQKVDHPGPNRPHRQPGHSLDPDRSRWSGGGRFRVRVRVRCRCRCRCRCYSFEGGIAAAARVGFVVVVVFVLVVVLVCVGIARSL
mmetsp:Transcript_24125/g.52842  ORF Transcript_24125/g.52842 Transcript_24125/m.52842 type:complete len:312 (-) Transcript_24125:667-1602(-)